MAVVSTRDDAPRPSSCLRRATLALLVVAVTGCCLLQAWAIGLGQDSLTWQTVGAVQLLAGPDELWVFVEVDRLVRHPGPLAEPPIVAYGHAQAVAVVTSSGHVRVVPVHPDDGPSFNANLGGFVHLDGRLHLLVGPHMGADSGLLRWEEPIFVGLPPRESIALLRAHGLERMRWPDLYATLAAVNRPAGSCSWPRTSPGDTTTSVARASRSRTTS